MRQKVSSTLPPEIEFPCSFCCKMMKFARDTFVNGGIVACKACGTKTRFKPHPEAGTHPKKKGHRRCWIGEPFTMDV